MKPWEAPGYLEKRREHRAAMKSWHAHAVAQGFIDPDGDLQNGLQDFWDDYKPIKQEFEAINEWLEYEARKLGFLISTGTIPGDEEDPCRDKLTGELILDGDTGNYLHTDKATEVSTEIQDALDEGKDPTPIIEAHWRFWTSD